ncbi:2-phospho-L-lactate guanylyltransferase [Roseibium sp.]|uniref:2-phospho-L-lactate guanylyltransferase n=1 Tax=Roseibium sp. TaxID=1936156 RepID=UPI003A96C482
MTTWVLIPVKDFKQAKTRLASLLSAKQREQLAKAMLQDTLSAASSAIGIDRIAIISNSSEAGKIADAFGVLYIEDRSKDLNGALQAGRAQLTEYGATSVLVLPADIPAVRSEDITTILTTSQTSASIVIVPAHDQDGTNALLLQSRHPLPYLFGPGSFDRHLAQASALGHPPQILAQSRIAADFDRPSDLERIDILGPGPRTKRLLCEFNLCQPRDLKEVS